VAAGQIGSQALKLGLIDQVVANQVSGGHGSDLRYPAFFLHGSEPRRGSPDDVPSVLPIPQSMLEKG
jgi:hypothetical protein